MEVTDIYIYIYIYLKKLHRIGTGSRGKFKYSDAPGPGAYDNSFFTVSKWKFINKKKEKSISCNTIWSQNSGWWE